MTELRKRFLPYLRSARRAIIWEEVRLAFARSSLAGLPLAALGVAVSERWMSGAWTLQTLGVLVAFVVLYSSIWGLLRRGSLFESARRVDARADLKGRLASAVQFLEEDALDAARRVQIDDALERASGLRYASLFNRRVRRWSAVVPCLLALLAASFFVPERRTASAVPVTPDPRRSHQLNEIAELREAFEKLAENDEELTEILEQLKEIEDGFRSNETGERDMMIQLSRLDESLSEKIVSGGARRAAAEIAEMIPYLRELDSMEAVSAALEAQAYERAAQELQKLGDSVRNEEGETGTIADLMDEMSAFLDEENEETDNSLLKALLDAIEDLKVLDLPGFGEEIDVIASRFRMVDKLQNMEGMKVKMDMARDSMGLQLKQCPVCKGKGCPACRQPAAQGMPGGGEAPSPIPGKGILGVPFSNRTRLEEAYRNFLEVSGRAGEGPVETRFEGRGAETVESKVAVMEVYVEYAEVAEEAMEKESLPLSHRFHVKRYFQAIHPQQP